MHQSLRKAGEQPGTGTGEMPSLVPVGKHALRDGQVGIGLFSLCRLHQAVATEKEKGQIMN